MHIRIQVAYSWINCPARPFLGLVLVRDRFGNYLEAFESEPCETAQQAKECAIRASEKMTI